MPKLPPLKVLRGHVACRTRARMGAPMYKSRPVQHPHNWPLLKYVTRDGTVSSKKKGLESPTCRYRSKSRETNAETSTSGMSRKRRSVVKRRHSDMDMDKDLFTLEPSMNYRKTKAETSKRLHRSLIQLVRFKPTRRDADSRADGSRHKRKLRKGTRKSRRGRTSRRRRRAGRTSGKRRRAPARRRRRATVGSRYRRRKRSSRVGQNRRRQRHRRKDYSENESRRRAIKPGSYPGHEHDQMLNEQDKVTTENLEAGYDEVKDDPLNVNDLCRSLVKGLYGTPADSRDVAPTDKKDERPELQKQKDDKRKRDAKKTRTKSRRSRKKASNRNTSYTQSASAKRHGRGGKQRKPRAIPGKKPKYEIPLIKRANRRINKMVKRIHHKSHGKHLHNRTTCKHRSHQQQSASRYHGRHPKHYQHHRQAHHPSGRCFDSSKQRRRKPADRSQRPRNRNNSRRSYNRNNNSQSLDRWLRVNGRLQRVSLFFLKRLRGWFTR